MVWTGGRTKSLNLLHWRYPSSCFLMHFVSALRTGLALHQGQTWWHRWHCPSRALFPGSVIWELRSRAWKGDWGKESLTYLYYSFPTGIRNLFYCLDFFLFLAIPNTECMLQEQILFHRIFMRPPAVLIRRVWKILLNLLLLLQLAVPGGIPIAV